MSGITNSDEKAFWSGPSGQDWVACQVQQDRLLSEVKETVLARAGLNEGDAVLDIGCGTGDLSVSAATVVGPGGRVLATDIAEPLLKRAGERLAQFPQARTMLGDAQIADWPAQPFDHAISRFGVMFFADPPVAFANIARALHPGAKITFASWAPARENPYWSDPARIAARQLGQPPKVSQDTPGPMGLADRDLTAERFRQAGLAGVNVEAVSVGMPFDGEAEAFSDLALRIGPAARVVRLFDASPEQIAEVRREIIDWARQYENGGTISIPAVINLIEARRP